MPLTDLSNNVIRPEAGPRAAKAQNHHPTMQRPPVASRKMAHAQHVRPRRLTVGKCQSAGGVARREEGRRQPCRAAPPRPATHLRPHPHALARASHVTSHRARTHRRFIVCVRVRSPVVPVTSTTRFYFLRKCNIESKSAHGNSARYKGKLCN